MSALEASERTHAEEVLARFDELDAALVSKGFPATSPWWRQTIERFYRSGKPQLVARVGRRGGKSSTLSRLSVVECLYGKHEVPPGDVGMAAFVSVGLDEAMGRLLTIKAILDAIGVGYEAMGPKAIRVSGTNRGFRVFTASIAGVSGFTCIFLVCDEVSKWLDRDTSTNPASEIIASAKPTMATQPNARIILSSSPFSTFDAHYTAFEEGTTPGQEVAHAATWESNPSITEEYTRTLERDAATWSREYAAIPQAEHISSLLTKRQLDKLLVPTMPPARGHSYLATMDPATRGHAWTLVISTIDQSGSRHVVFAHEWRGSPAAPLDPSRVCPEIAEMVAPYGCRTVHTDQHAFDYIAAFLRQSGLNAHGHPWTRTNIDDACRVLEGMVNSGTFFAPEGVHSDLLGIHRVLTQTGIRHTFAERDGRHSDFAPAILMAVTLPIGMPDAMNIPMAMGGGFQRW